MQHILVLGSGKIGQVVAKLLSKKYKVTLAAILHECTTLAKVELVTLDATDQKKLTTIINDNKIDAVISCLPHFITEEVAQTVISSGVHYFDLTEDVKTTNRVSDYAKNAPGLVVPQCGLAPGFISIVTQNMMQEFDEIDLVKMRVGALPIHVSNALQYALTWSTDGLINEYMQDGVAIRNSKKTTVPGLSGLETLKIDGLTYEAFHTSGGIGSLVESFVGRVKHMDYKTIRYPGHCDKMHFLLKQLRMELKPEWLKQILETAIPQTTQDLVLIYVSVIGKKNGILLDRHYSKKIYAGKLQGISASAIQISTASSVCAVVDLLLSQQNISGLIRQENIDYQKFLDNEYGAIFAIGNGSSHV